MNEAWIETVTGQKFYLFYPQRSVVNIMDIAHALSHTCRYNGHTGHFYSVAEHSVHVAGYLEEVCGSPQAQMVGLLHDAAEAYIGDIVTPLKKSFPSFEHLEHDIHTAILNQLCPEIIETAFDPNWASTIKIIDRRIVVDEREALMLPTEHDWGLGDLDKLNIPIYCWAAPKACEKFISTYAHLKAQMTVAV